MNASSQYYYEDLKLNQTFESPPIEINPVEVDVFNIITYHADRVDNTKNIHMNPQFAKELGFSDRIVPGLFLLTLINKAFILLNLYKGALLLLGLNNIVFKHPVYPGDKIRVKFTVIDKKRIEKWINKGIVTFHVDMINQKDEIVCVADASYQYLMRSATNSI